MTNRSNSFFVITGGPGSGKTTLLDALAQAGFARMPEAGRAIIKDQQAIGGGALPWDDRTKFAELMLAWELRSWREAHEVQARTGAVFFDRGVPDTIGYLRLEGLPVPAPALRAAEIFRYNTRVFIAPPWPEIYAQDAERKQDFALAERTYQAMADSYGAAGYALVTLPRTSVEERVRFVREAAGV